MSDFQKEFDQRMRRVCGITDDNLQVRYEEYVNQSFWSGDPTDTDHGASYTIEVYVYKEVGTYKIEGVAARAFDSLSDFINAVMAVKL